MAKCPAPSGAGLCESGGGGGSRTPVQDRFTTASTCVSDLLSRIWQADRQAWPDTRPHDAASACSRRLGPRQGLLVDASTLSRHRRFSDGPKVRPRRRSYRSQLGFDRCLTGPTIIPGTQPRFRQTLSRPGHPQKGNSDKISYRQQKDKAH